MSKQLVITAPNMASVSTTYKVETRTLSDFSSIPSKTFTSGWNIISADISFSAKSYALFSGDLWVYFKSKNGTTTTLLNNVSPGFGSTYKKSVLSQVQNYQGDFNSVEFKFSSDLSKTVSFSDLKITYVAIPYTLYLGTNGYGTAKSEHVNDSDASVKLTATPNEGYRFARWSDGSTANPYIYNPGNVNSAAITAIFEPIEYSVYFWDKINNT
jgi:hypothetical protein